MTGYPEPTYTQTPNALFDLDLRDMGEAELKVTLVIVRKILGYHKTRPEAVSYSQLQEFTGLSRQAVRNGVQAALKRGRIKLADKKGPRGVNRYSINFRHVSSEKAATSLLSRPVLVNEVDSQKKDSKEKNITTALEEQCSGAQGAEPVRPEDDQPATKAPTPQQAMFKAIADSQGWDLAALTPTRQREIGKVASELNAANATPAQVAGLWTYLQDRAKREEWRSVTINSMSKYWPDYHATLKPSTPDPARPTVFVSEPLKDKMARAIRERDERLRAEGRKL